MIKNILELIKERKESINKIIPFAVAIYFILVSLPNISFLSIIFSNNIMNNIYRAVIAISFLLLCGCYWIANDFKINKYNKQSTVFFISSFIFLGVSLLSPIFGLATLGKSYYTDAYFRLIEIKPSLGLISYFSYYGNLLTNFAFIYFFFLLIAKSKDIKVFEIAYFTLIAFTCLSCILSLFLDYKNFIEIFKMNSTGYGSFDISSIFTSKNTFGAYLMLTVIFSTYFAFSKNKLFFISAGLSFAFLIFTLSKTAIVVALLYVAFSYFYQLFLNYKNNKKIWNISLAIISSITLLFVLFVLTPINEYINIFSYINKFLFSSSSNSISERIVLQLIYFRNVTPLNFLFGYGNTLDYNTYYWTKLEHNNFASVSLENGFLQVLGSYGFFALIFYFYLMYKIIKHSFYENTYFYKSKIAILLSFSIYMFMERYYLFIGGGGITLLISLFLTAGLDINKKEKRISNGSYFEISI